MNRIIVPTGYMGSGSSAITDLIAEFKDCANDFKSFEYIFLHCPNGLFDLEDNLLKGNNAIKSDASIRAFKEQMEKLNDKPFWWVGNYKQIIGQEFMIKTNDFIKNITQFKIQNYWYTHEEVNLKMFIKLLIRKPIKILSKNKLCNKKILKYKDGMYISFIKPEEFYQKAKDYIYEIISLIGKERNNIIMDQMLLPFNLHRIDNYFDDKLKVIVVERDPRDIFITNKYIWTQKKIGIPMPLEVNEFCEFYKNMRESEIEYNSKKVLRIRFEDLIYNYEIELKKIMKFLNFKSEDHINPKGRFNPDLSIKNTQVFNSKKYANEIKVIEEKLSKYLYDFPYKLKNDVTETIEFE